MKNPFSKQAQPKFRPNRNTFDLSKQKLFTTEFGRITPVYCKEVLPGDSWKIDSTLVIQGMPTQFPVQTRIRASVHYFYVRNRTLMDKWEDFIFKTKQVTPAWLQLTSERAKKMISTGSLGDLLGIPSTISGYFERHRSSNGFFLYLFKKSSTSDILFSPFELSSYATTHDLTYSGIVNSVSDISFFAASYVYNPSVLSSVLYNPYVFDGSKTGQSSAYPLVLAIYEKDRSFSPSYSLPKALSRPLLIDTVNVIGYNSSTSTGSSINVPSSFVDLYNPNEHVLILMRSWRLPNSNQNSLSTFGPGGDIFYSYFIPTPTQTLPLPLSSIEGPFDQILYTALVPDIIDSTDDEVIGDNPFVGDDPTERLSALPFRAYEMICNYFYRNDLNNPYVLDGEVQYNEFIPTHDAGPDENLYDFHMHNWELDRFTSATQSPQFGEAPLVGIIAKRGSDHATFQFQEPVDPSLDPQEGKKYEVNVHLDDMGGIDGITDYDKDTPSGSLQRIMELSTTGISINDLRNVNSFQRFLENTLRRGLRYRNQLKSHFGVSVDFPDIDVPQFIGGYSGLLNVSKITSQADTSSAGLGDFVGQITGVVNGKHDIYCYTPEHGFIIGLLSICPVPTYSQTLDPMFLRHHSFDYFQQEFDKIGHVPITYAQLCPLQVADPTEVFGYQRAWYDYISDMDSVHGDFRTTLRDFVLTRIFNQKPELSSSFTTIDKDQLNDIWITDNMVDKFGSSSKFLCQIFHAVAVKRQISRYGTPSLE